MGKLINSSKHIAFCKASRPKEKNNYDLAKTFFVVEQANGDVVFHITQKPNISGGKLKGSQKVQSFLEKKKLLPEKSFKVDKKAKIVIGKLWMEGGKYKISIDIKANGGGKSTLMGVEFKKFGLGKFKDMYSKGPQTVEQDAEDADVKELQDKAGGRIFSNKKTEAAVKLLKKINNLNPADLAANGGDEAALERALRNLKKYDDGGYVEHMLARENKEKWASLDIPTEDQVAGWMDAIEGHLNAAQDAIDEEAAVEEAEDAAAEDVGTEEEETELKEAVMLEVWFKNSAKKYKSARKSQGAALDALWNAFDDANKVTELADVLTGGDVVKLLAFEQAFGSPLPKLYDTFADLSTLRDIFVGQPVRGKVATFKAKMEEWGGTGAWNEQDILVNRSRSFFDDANPGEANFVWTVVRGNPIAAAHNAIKPTCFQYSGNDNLSFEWSIPASLAAKLDNIPLYNQLLRQPIHDVYSDIVESITGALEQCETMHQFRLRYPGDEDSEQDYSDAVEAYIEAIEEGQSLFNSKTEKIMLDSWAELQKMDKALVSWKRSFYKDATMSAAGAIIGGISAGAAAAQLNPLGFVMGVWGAVKAVNKMFLTLARRFEELETSYNVASHDFAQFRTNFRDWSASNGLTEAGSNFVNLLIGFPAFESSKSVKAELENCYGKASNVMSYCQGYSTDLRNLLDQMDSIDMIIKNREEYGLSTANVVKLNTDFETMRRKVDELILDVEKKMSTVMSVRQWVPNAIEFMTDVRKKRPALLKTFDTALTATEFGLAFATGLPSDAAAWTDLTNATGSLLNEIKERYDEGTW